jgi:hypothetical protein
MKAITKVLNLSKQAMPFHRDNKAHYIIVRSNKKYSEDDAAHARPRSDNDDILPNLHVSATIPIEQAQRDFITTNKRNWR